MEAGRLRHVLEVAQFERGWIEQELIPETARMERAAPMATGNDPLRGRKLANLFYQESLLTASSFAEAMEILGGRVRELRLTSLSPQAREQSIEDTVRILRAWHFDALVIRAEQTGGAARAAAVAEMPVFNAGEPEGEHPTQALLDLVTIVERRGAPDGLRIALVGDTSFWRWPAMRSFVKLLAMRYRGVHFHFISPAVLKVTENIEHAVGVADLSFDAGVDLRRVAAESDVLYFVAGQFRHFELQQMYASGNGERCYALTDDVMSSLRPEAVILHPLPKGPELPDAFLSDPRVAVFRQAENGLYVRMALLRMVLAGA
jgi:aspartate carbamoyltransferase catalytic subunit